MNRTAIMLAEAFDDKGFELFLVGGAVRDELLGAEVKDLDFTTNARPAEIVLALMDMGVPSERIFTMGASFGTVGARIDDEDVEITTFRADAYDGVTRKPVVEFGDVIDDDLLRRDFTFNAMAKDVLTGEVVDLFDGMDDLRAKRLRTPGDPEVAFAEDPLRIIRAARFIARFSLTPDTAVVAAARHNAEGLRTIVSAERVRAELLRVLAEDGAFMGLRFLANVGVFAEVFPELLPTRAVGLLETPLERLVVCFTTSTVEAVEARLRALTFTNDEVRTATRLLQFFNDVVFAEDRNDKRFLARKILVEMPESLVDSAVALLVATTTINVVNEVDELRDADFGLKVDGRDVMRELKLGKGGPVVGKALAAVKATLIKNGPMDRFEQLDVVRAFGRERGF